MSIKKSENYNPLVPKTKEYLKGWDRIFKDKKRKDNESK